MNALFEDITNLESLRIGVLIQVVQLESSSSILDRYPNE
jgi:hypothetical protein